MTKIFNRSVAIVLSLLVLISLFAVAIPVLAGSVNDPVDDCIDYSSSGRVSITANQDTIWFGQHGDGSWMWFLNGNPGACMSPDKKSRITTGTFTKYYLKNDSNLAKAFFYLLPPLDADGDEIGYDAAKAKSTSGFYLPVEDRQIMNNAHFTHYNLETASTWWDAYEGGGRPSYWRILGAASERIGGDGEDSHELYALAHFLLGRIASGETLGKTYTETDYVLEDLIEVVDMLPDVPEYAKVFYIDGNQGTGESGWYQSFMSAEPRYYFTVQKSSAIPEVSKGNKAYSTKGIRYSVSTSKSDFDPDGNNYIGYIELDKNGFGHSIEGSRPTLSKNLSPGTYYLKESVIPEDCNYEMSDTVYTVKLNSSHTYNQPLEISVTDEPKLCYFDIQKESANPEISDADKDKYSMEGIEYYVSKSNTDFDPNGTNYIGMIKLDKNGYGHSKKGSRTLNELGAGTYYVQEGYIPPSRALYWERSTEVYTITVNTSNTVNQPLHLNVTEVPKVRSASLQIIKKSDNETFTTDNACYSLKGAEFKVYEVKTDDFGKEIPNYEKQVGTTYVTNDSGSIEIPSGVLEVGKKYAIEEKKAPKGFDLYTDKNGNHYIISDTLTTEGCTVTFEEPCKGDPATVKVIKKGSNNKEIPGVIFTVTHFSDPTITTKEQAEAAKNTITRSWDFVTKGNGSFSYSEEYLYEGYTSKYPDYIQGNDSEHGLYYMTQIVDGVEKTSTAFPLGTVMIQEKWAPERYDLDFEPKFINITEDYVEGEPVPFEVTVVDPENKKTVVEARKIWSDDGDREGVRPNKLTVTLYRDGEIYEDVPGGAVQELNDGNNWTYSWGELYEEENIYDENKVYLRKETHKYEVVEEEVEGYYLTRTAKRQIEGGHRWVFYNKHDIAYKPLVINKVWDNNNDASGLQPDEVKVKVFRISDSGEELLTKDDKHNAVGDNGIITLSKNTETPYQFVIKDLYKYYGGGKEYSYRVEEVDVPDYFDVNISYGTVPVKVADGVGGMPDTYADAVKTTIKNTEKTGAATLLKVNSSDEPLPQVGFKLYRVEGNTAKSVSIVKNDTIGKFEFTGFGAYDSAEEVFTGDDGKVSFDKLPFGDYFLLETTTANGYIPFEDRIEFSISPDDPDFENVSVGIVNSKSILPETGGMGNYIFYGIGALALIGVIVLVIVYIKKKNFRKEK
jgi:LPXTG-motif cell wall-anchored protein